MVGELLAIELAGSGVRHGAASWSEFVSRHPFPDGLRFSVHVVTPHIEARTSISIFLVLNSRGEPVWQSGRVSACKGSKGHSRAPWSDGHLDGDASNTLETFAINDEVLKLESHVGCWDQRDGAYKVDTATVRARLMLV